MVLKRESTVFVALNVICVYGFGWVVMVSICVVVLLGKLQCRMPSLSLATYDIRIGGG